MHNWDCRENKVKTLIVFYPPIPPTLFRFLLELGSASDCRRHSNSSLFFLFSRSNGGGYRSNYDRGSLNSCNKNRDQNNGNNNNPAKWTVDRLIDFSFATDPQPVYASNSDVRVVLVRDTPTWAPSHHSPVLLFLCLLRSSWIKEVAHNQCLHFILPTIPIVFEFQRRSNSKRMSWACAQIF